MIPWKIESVEVTESTNTDLLERLRSHEINEAFVRVAAQQTAGRGRLGRRWENLKGTQLLFSLAYPFALQASQIAPLSLVCGLAVIKALEKFSELDAQKLKLKWPNDIVIDLPQAIKKTGGILIETTRVQTTLWAVIGMGLNLALEHSTEAPHAPSDLASISAETPMALAAGSLSEICQHKPGFTREQVLTAVLHELEKTLPLFEQSGFAPFQHTWNQYDIFAEQWVTLSHQNVRTTEGKARGVNQQGQLQLETPEGHIAIHSGELSLRLKQS